MYRTGRQLFLRCCLLSAVGGAAVSGCATFRFDGSRPRLNAEAGQLTRQARNALATGSHQLARRLLNRSLQCCPDDPQALLMLAEADQANGEQARSVQNLTRLAAQFPDRPDVRLALARVLLATGEPERARVEATQATLLAPEDPSAWQCRAQAELAMNAPAPALLHFQRAWSLPDAPADLPLWIARTHAALHQPERAVAVLEHARVTGNEEEIPPDLLVYEAGLLLELGQNRRAVDLLRETASRRNSSPAVSAALCRALQADRRNSEARQVLAEALQRWPESPELASLDDGNNLPTTLAVRREPRQNP